jgi:GcrA cell cycle regulator
MRKFEQQNPVTPWTEPEDNLLRKRWAEGFSASQIAGLLEGRSRNSVIGRTHRLGLCGDRKTTHRSPRGGVMAPTKTSQGYGKRILTPPHLQRTESLAAVVPPARLLPPMVPDLPLLSQRGEASRGVPFADLERHMCKFVINNSPTRDGHEFCGKQRKPDSPYCIDCHARCYAGVSTRRPALPMRRAA